MKKLAKRVKVTIKLQEENKTLMTYEDMFISERTMNKRGDKSVYIRTVYHERLSRIVQVIGEDKIPLYVLLDNILTHHFEVFEELLINEFKQKSKPLF